MAATTRKSSFESGSASSWSCAAADSTAISRDLADARVPWFCEPKMPWSSAIERHCSRTAAKQRCKGWTTRFGGCLPASGRFVACEPRRCIGPMRCRARSSVVAVSTCFADSISSRILLDQTVAIHLPFAGRTSSIG